MRGTLPKGSASSPEADCKRTTVVGKCVPQAQNACNRIAEHIIYIYIYIHIFLPALLMLCQWCSLEERWLWVNRFTVLLLHSHGNTESSQSPPRSCPRGTRSFIPGPSRQFRPESWRSARSTKVTTEYLEPRRVQRSKKRIIAQHPEGTYMH